MCHVIQESHVGNPGVTCYLGITCWEARHSLLDGDCMQGIQMWHIKMGAGYKESRCAALPRSCKER